jgi:hypothetical protein
VIGESPGAEWISLGGRLNGYLLNAGAPRVGCRFHLAGWPPLLPFYPAAGGYKDKHKESLQLNSMLDRWFGRNFHGHRLHKIKAKFSTDN